MLLRTILRSAAGDRSGKSDVARVERSETRDFCFKSLDVGPTSLSAVKSCGDHEQVVLGELV